MALQQITQEELDSRLLSPSYPGHASTYDEEERENFRPPRNSSNYGEADNSDSGLSPSEEILYIQDFYRILESHFPDTTSNYDETENSVPELSPSEPVILSEQEFYQILRSRLRNATQDQRHSLLDNLADYLYQIEVEWMANKRDGLTEETISQFMKSRTCQDDGDLLDICVVCQSEYEPGEMLGTLECGHEYHESCIRRWLLEKNNCPVCKRRAIGHHLQVEEEEEAAAVSVRL